MLAFAKIFLLDKFHLYEQTMADTSDSLRALLRSINFATNLSLREVSPVWADSDCMADLMAFFLSSVMFSLATFSPLRKSSAERGGPHTEQQRMIQ